MKSPWRGIALLTMTWCSAAIAGGSSDTFFRPLDDAPGGVFYSYPYAISADGGTVAGRTENEFGVEACIWRPDGSMEMLGDFGGGTHTSTCRGVSMHGALAVGNGTGASGTRAFLYAPGSELTPLTDYAPGRSALVCQNVSNNGRFLVGYDTGFLTGWRLDLTSGVLLDLPFSPTGFREVANAISGDGNLVGGYVNLATTTLAAHYWTPSLGWRPIEGLSNLSTCLDVSDDGSTLVGVHQVPLGGPASGQGFVWRRGYPFQRIIDLPGGNSNSIAFGVAADGRVAVGAAEDADGIIAIVWTRNRGLRTVESLLAGRPGIDLEGWRLQVTTDVAADGVTICGYGLNPQGHTQAWTARVGPHCFEDLNGDDLVNNVDLGILLGTWRQPSDLADVNLDGLVNAVDLAMLLGSWGPCR